MDILKLNFTLRSLRWKIGLKINKNETVSHLFYKFLARKRSQIVKSNVKKFGDFIFIHIPKAGGSAVCENLFEVSSGHHLTAVEVRSVVGKEYWRSKMSFAVVRNPEERFLSAYSYLFEGGNNLIDKNVQLNVIQKYSNVDEFVDKWMCSRNLYKVVHFIPQVDFLCDGNNSLLVKKLFPFEEISQLPQHFDFFQDKKMVKKNASKKKFQLNQFSKRKIHKLYKRDIMIYQSISS